MYFFAAFSERNSSRKTIKLYKTLDYHVKSNQLIYQKLKPTYETETFFRKPGTEAVLHSDDANEDNNSNH